MRLFRRRQLKHDVFQGIAKTRYIHEHLICEKEYSGASANCEVHLCIYKYNNLVTCLFRLVRKKVSVGEGPFGWTA